MQWPFKLLLTALASWRLVSASATSKDIVIVKLNTSQLQTFGSVYCGQVTGTNGLLECLAVAQTDSPLIVGYNEEECQFCELQQSSAYVTLENTFSDAFGWYFVKGKLKLKTGRYTIFTKSEKLLRAKEICGVENGHLVAFETEEEFNEMNKRENGWSYWAEYWLGASDLANEGEFIWEHSGQKLNDTFEIWHPNEPNNGHSSVGGEDCVFTWTVKFLDIPCDTDPKSYICEYEHF